MTKLEQARKKINEIDEKMANFLKRGWKQVKR